MIESAESNLLTLVKPRSTWVLTSKTSPTNPNDPLDQVNTHLWSTLGQRHGQTPLKPSALFVWLISHQPAVFFSHNKPAINTQPTVLFSQNKSAPATSQLRNEQAPDVFERPPELLLRSPNFT
jgi:hypothetical protein